MQRSAPDPSRDSPGVQLLEATRELFETEHLEFVPTGRLLAWLGARDDRPWEARGRATTGRGKRGGARRRSRCWPRSSEAIRSRRPTFGSDRAARRRSAGTSARGSRTRLRDTSRGNRHNRHRIGYRCVGLGVSLYPIRQIPDYRPEMLGWPKSLCGKRVPVVPVVPVRIDRFWRRGCSPVVRGGFWSRVRGSGSGNEMKRLPLAMTVAVTDAETHEARDILQASPNVREIAPGVRIGHSPHADRLPLMGAGEGRTGHRVPCSRILTAAPGKLVRVPFL